MNTLLNIIVNTNTRESLNIAAFVPARSVSLRLLSRVNLRSTQPGLNFCIPLLQRQSATFRRTSQRSVLFLKGDKYGTVRNLSVHSQSDNLRGDRLRGRPELLAVLEKLVRTSMPAIKRSVDIKHKLPLWIKIVKKKMVKP